MNKTKRLSIALPLILLGSIHANEMPDLPYGYDSADDEEAIFKLLKQAHRARTSPTETPQQQEPTLPTADTEDTPEELPPSQVPEYTERSKVTIEELEREQIMHEWQQTREQHEQCAVLTYAQEQVQTAQEKLETLEKAGHQNAVVGAAESGLAAVVITLQYYERFFHEGIVGVLEATALSGALMFDITRRYINNADMEKEAALTKEDLLNAQAELEKLQEAASH